jgi:hypothetical protein
VHKDENCLQVEKPNNEENSNELVADYVLINNSPIDLGHVLLVPRLYSGLNQVRTI